MNKTKIIIGINIVFIALIIMAFLPALITNDDGYNTKTAAVIPAQPEEAVSTDMDETLDADEANVEALAEVTAEEDKVDEVATAESEATPTIEPTITDEVSEMTEQPATAIVTPVDQPTTSASADGLYSVVDGNKLDASSYAGFKLYRNWCARCHGTYGQGMVGPDLAESLKLISKEEFYDTVENGKSGTIGSMPAWKANVQVMENRDQLYAYLKARSDGAIGVEKPKKQ